VAPGGFPDTAAATGATRSGRRAEEAGRRGIGTASGGKLGGDDHGRGMSGPRFVSPTTRRTCGRVLSGDVGDAAATARSAARGQGPGGARRRGGRPVPAAGLVDQIVVDVLVVLPGDGIRFLSPGLARIDLEPASSTRPGAVTILRLRVRK
jgi:hypothetical protein